MLDRELKQVIARVSMATLIVIAIFVTLAVVLTARYDIGTQTAHANEGEHTPTPTPTPTPYYSQYPLPTTREVTFGGVVPSGRVFVAFNQANTTWGAYGFGKSTISDTDALIAWNPSTNSMTTSSLTADDSRTSGTGVFDPRTPPTSPQSTSVSASWADGNEVPSCGAGSSNDGTLGPTSPAIQVDLYHVSDINGTNTLVRASQGTWSVSVDGTTSVTYEWSSNLTTEKGASSPWSGKIVGNTNLMCKVTIGGTIVITKHKVVSVTNRTGSPWDSTNINQCSDGTFGPNPPTRDQDLGQSYPRDASGTKYVGNPTTQQVSSGPNKGLWYVTGSTVKYNFQSDYNPELLNSNSDFCLHQGDSPGEITVSELQTAVRNHEADGNPSHKYNFALEANSGQGNCNATLEYTLGPSSFNQAQYEAALVSTIHTGHAAAALAASAYPEPYYLNGKTIDFTPYNP